MLSSTHSYVIANKPPIDIPVLAVCKLFVTWTSFKGLSSHESSVAHCWSMRTCNRQLISWTLQCWERSDFSGWSPVSLTNKKNHLYLKMSVSLRFTRGPFVQIGMFWWLAENMITEYGPHYLPYFSPFLSAYQGAPWQPRCSNRNTKKLGTCMC